VGAHQFRNINMSDNEIKVIFAPGCFDEFEGTQEELDEMIAQIMDAVESGEIFENAEDIDIEDIDTEFADHLGRYIQSGTRTLH